MEEYVGVLQACYFSFSIFNRLMEKLGFQEIMHLNQASLTSKIQSLSSHTQMDMIIQSIAGLARAMNVLSMAFQSYETSRLLAYHRNPLMSSRETAIKASEVMRRTDTMKILERASGDSISLHDSLKRESSIMESSEIDSVLGNEAFVFDDILINTTIYRRAFARQVVQSEQNEFQHPSQNRAFPPQANRAGNILPSSHNDSGSTSPESMSEELYDPGTYWLPQGREASNLSSAPTNRLPTLYEVLTRQAIRPYDLFQFYLYMRDIKRSVDYLDCW